MRDACYGSLNGASVLWSVIVLVCGSVLDRPQASLAAYTYSSHFFEPALTHTAIWYTSSLIHRIRMLHAKLHGMSRSHSHARVSGYVYLRIAFHAVKWGRFSQRLCRGHAATGRWGTYLRRQHGQVCFDAEDREARFSRQSSHNARQLPKYIDVSQRYNQHSISQT